MMGNEIKGALEVIRELCEVDGVWCPNSTETYSGEDDLKGICDWQWVCDMTDDEYERLQNDLVNDGYCTGDTVGCWLKLFRVKGRE